jgi:uncharacterized protein YecE (DUF72 family)
VIGFFTGGAGTRPALPLADFLANGLFELRGKLGPILWQFPPMLPFKHDRFEASSRCCRTTPRPQRASPSGTTSASPAA